MKKNLLLGAMALLGMFTSCSQTDFLEQKPENESNHVSMAIEMPAEFTSTRALPTAPANHQLRCILEIWTDDGTSLKLRKEQVVSGASLKFDFTLDQAGDYKAVLWADYIDATATADANGFYADKYYTTNASTAATGLKKVSIISGSYSSSYANGVREAFSAVESFTKDNASKAISTTLTHPLTKLTIAEKTVANVELCAAVKAVYNVPSEFNAFDKTVGSAVVPVTYDAAPVGETVSTTNYKSLFTDYVLTGETDSSLGEIALTFTAKDGKPALNAKTIPAGVTLKRNYWVRAAGNLITSNYDSNTSVNVDMTTDWTDKNEDTSIIYAVGDLYPDATNPVGVVFWKDPNNSAKGKVVNLNETADARFITNLDGIDIGGTNDSNGKANTTTIVNLTTSYAWATEKPALKWLAGLNGKPDGGWDANTDKWYMPAFDELSALFDAVNNTAGFNDKLGNNGTAITLNKRYISSTMIYVSGYGYVMAACRTSSNATKTQQNPTLTGSYMRAIMAF